ncbi:MAG: thiamine-phosphate kinase [Epsilonproteobacteria bacterium]|nr:thiamine-phosphate kinase [Campylobacterota bacterium]NPA56174.1 thiamine-phosphate kinase [Campylobacterota bacterium]
MDRERFFISLFNDKRIGDDGVLIDGKIYSADAFCEGTHFRRGWLTFGQIGAKALLVNISDAVAMNGRPRYALVSISIPRELGRGELREIASALEEVGRRWGIEIVGGDTVGGEGLHISITLISQVKRPIFRRPLRLGYLLGYTGELGSVERDLRRLLRGGRVSRRSKFVTPRVRSSFMERAGRVIEAAMDISDGLLDDLGKMTTLNRVGVHLFRRIPKRVGCSGEEYEILFAIDPRKREALVRRARASRTPITIFGKVVRGRYRTPCRSHHF